MPLCPGLYDLLRREFGDVGIANEGDELIPGALRHNAVADRTEREVLYGVIGEL